VTVFDASALLAFLLDEPGADIVEERIREAGDSACISSVNLVEVVDKLIRGVGQTEERVGETMDWLMAGGLLFMPTDGDMGRLAGELRARHYRRQESPLSLADCMALSTAISLDTPLATSDAVLAAVAGDEGVQVLALPNSRGKAPAAD
jgi:PIN domain nuclease of toxin-antitoxin system